MLNFPVPRRQSDGAQREWSDATSLTFDPKEDRTDQRFKDEADINWIAKRFGFVNGGPNRQPQFVDNDSTIDLQQALEAQRSLERAFSRLDPTLKVAYSSWDQVIAAMDSGDVIAQDGKLVLKPEPSAPPPIPPEPPPADR